jgi:hypothetical protein
VGAETAVLPVVRVGESVPGVLGPLDEAAEVNDDWEPPFELAAEEMELTRGDELLDEYACGGCCGRGNDGSLSLAYNGRCAAWTL